MNIQEEASEEVVLTHNSFVEVEQFLRVPEDDLDGNRHLYTCTKKARTSPPAISELVRSGDAFEGSMNGQGYLLKGVEDLDSKLGDHWCFRIFQNQVCCTELSLSFGSLKGNSNICS